MNMMLLEIYLKQSEGLSNNYTPPEDACTTYKLSYKKLEEFENDLHQHIHLKIIYYFLKSIKLESELSFNNSTDPKGPVYFIICT